MAWCQSCWLSEHGVPCMLAAGRPPSNQPGKSPQAAPTVHMSASRAGLSSACVLLSSVRPTKPWPTSSTSTVPAPADTALPACREEADQRCAFKKHRPDAPAAQLAAVQRSYIQPTSLRHASQQDSTNACTAAKPQPLQEPKRPPQLHHQRQQDLQLLTTLILPCSLYCSRGTVPSPIKP